MLNVSFLTPKLVAAVIGVIGFFISPSLFAQTHSAASGIIYFSGEIVEDGCAVAPRQNNIHISCFDSQHQIKTAQIATKAYSPQPLPGNRGTTEMEWLDNSRTTGVVTVSYH